MQSLVRDDQNRPPALDRQPVGDVQLRAPLPAGLRLRRDDQIGSARVLQDGVADVGAAGIGLAPLDAQAATARGGLERCAQHGVVLAVGHAQIVEHDGIGRAGHS